MTYGDAVIYIGGYSEELTKHKKYIIENVLMTMTYGNYSTSYDIINDKGMRRDYDKKYFVSVDEFRDIKISTLLSE